MSQFIFDFIFDPKIHFEITMTIESNIKQSALRKAKNLLTNDLRDNIIKVYIHEEIE